MSGEERESTEDRKAPAPSPREQAHQTARQYPARFERAIPDRSRFEQRVIRRNDPEE